jgi:hypothetical protein
MEYISAFHISYWWFNDTLDEAANSTYHFTRFAKSRSQSNAWRPNPHLMAWTSSDCQEETGPRGPTSLGTPSRMVTNFHAASLRRRITCLIRVGFTSRRLQPRYLSRSGTHPHKHNDCPHSSCTHPIAHNKGLNISRFLPVYVHLL